MDSETTQAILISSVSAFVGVAFSYLFFKKTKSEKYFNAKIQSYEVVSSPQNYQNDFEIRFRGKNIPNLYSANCRFWNAGNVTIHGNEINSADPLHVMLPEGATLLDYQPGKCTHRRVAPILDEKESGVRYSFDVLEPRDGFTFRILYTLEDSESDESAKPKALGSIAGVREIGKIDPTLLARTNETLSLMLVLFLVGVALLLGYALIRDLFESVNYLLEFGPRPFWDRFANSEFGASLKILVAFAAVTGGIFLTTRIGKMVERFSFGRSKPPLTLFDNELSLEEEELLIARLQRRRVQLRKLEKQA